MNYTHLQLEKRGHVAIVRMSNPPANTWTRDSLAALERIAKEAKDPKVRQEAEKTLEEAKTPARNPEKKGEKGDGDALAIGILSCNPIAARASSNRCIDCWPACIRPSSCSSA